MELKLKLQGDECWIDEDGIKNRLLERMLNA